MLDCFCLKIAYFQAPVTHKNYFTFVYVTDFGLLLFFDLVFKKCREKLKRVLKMRILGLPPVKFVNSEKKA